MKIIITESSRDRLALNWLNKEFGDLTKVVKDGSVFYVDEDGLPLFYYQKNKKNGYVYINYDRIWSLIRDIFGLDDSQTREIITISLEDIYKLRGYIPVWYLHSDNLMLDE